MVLVVGANELSFVFFNIADRHQPPLRAGTSVSIVQAEAHQVRDALGDVTQRALLEWWALLTTICWVHRDHTLASRVHIHTTRGRTGAIAPPWTDFAVDGAAIDIALTFLALRAARFTAVVRLHEYGASTLLHPSTARCCAVTPRTPVAQHTINRARLELALASFIECRANKATMIGVGNDGTRA